MKNRFIRITLIQLVLVIFSFGLFNGCSKKKDEDQTENSSALVAEKTAVKTFEIISLKITESLSSSYSGTFGGLAVELSKTSDSTLSFMVPDVAIGEQVLNFDLAKIKFSVTKTQVVDADQLVTSVMKNFDDQVALLDTSTTEGIEAMKQEKQEILDAFNSLSADEKKQTALFYEANKSIFEALINSVNNNLNDSTSFKTQSEAACPTTDYKSTYLCKAQKLGVVAQEVGAALTKIHEYKSVGLFSSENKIISFLSSVTKPASLVVATYLFYQEAKPAVLKFKASLAPFLKEKWVFSNQLFNSNNYQFPDQQFKTLNLKAKFRTVDSDLDQYLLPDFFAGISSAQTYWYEFTSLGEFPPYQNLEEEVILSEDEISISILDNQNVKLLDQEGDQVKFMMLSTMEEKFQYEIIVTKEGFVEKQNLFGSVDLRIGQNYQGGTIVYLDGKGHGIVAAPIDQSDAAPWGCDGILLSGAMGNYVGDGEQNTLDIVNGCSEPGTAARICYDLVLGGYDDWYLPSDMEYQDVNLASETTGVDVNATYWSSTQKDANYAHARYGQWSKTKNFRVRAVRSF
jgi:hypothetical protein